MKEFNQTPTEKASDDLTKEVACEATSLYSDYWPEFIASHRDIIKSNRQVAQTAQSTDKFRSRTESIITDSWELVGRDASTEVRNFYFRLGSLNSLVGAEEVLAKAGLIMQRRGEAASPGEGSAHDQLLSGCLFHEAALTSEGAFRASMLSRALSQYQEALDRSGGDMVGVNAQRALRYSYDIQFQRVFDAALSGKTNPDLLRSMHGDLQIQYIDEFINYLDQLDLQETDLRRQIRAVKGHERDELRKKLDGSSTHARGMCLEWFSVMAYRRIIDQADLHEDTFIRTAFPREEEPWFSQTTKSQRKGKCEAKQVPKHGFDVLIVSKNEDGDWYRRPVQLKVGVGNGHYLPEIEKVAFSYKEDTDLLGILRDAAISMRKEYTNQPLDLSERRSLEATVNPFHHRLAA